MDVSSRKPTHLFDVIMRNKLNEIYVFLSAFDMNFQEHLAIHNLSI